MSRVLMLRCLVNERLTAAAEDIFALFERTIAEYEEELSRSKDENQRKQRLRHEPCHRSGVAAVSHTQHFDSSAVKDEDSDIKQEPEEEEELGYPSVVVQVDEEQSVVRQYPDARCSEEDRAVKQEPTASSSTHLETEGNKEDMIKNSVKAKNHVCGECGKAFGWKATWKRHVAMHSDSSPYTCAICSKRFPQKSHLDTHMVTHTGEKPFSCSQCNTKFSQKQNLVRHMIIHSGEKSYSCTVCGKQFSHKHSVQMHMLTHTGEKPFSCSLCDTRFTKKPHLNRHMKCCHYGEKPYSCPVCQKSFVQKCDVQRHLKIHTRKVQASQSPATKGQ